MYWRIYRNPTTDQMNLYNIVSIFGLLLCSPIAAFSPGARSLQSISLPSQHLHLKISLPSPTQSLAKAVSSTKLSFTPKEESDDSSDDKPFIRPALHNSPFFRSLAILYALLFAIYQGSSPDSIQKVGKMFILSPKNAATVHLLSFSVFFGTTVYTTFIAGITMFKVRHVLICDVCICIIIHKMVIIIFTHIVSHQLELTQESLWKASK